jgi:hypothetical protein
MLYAVVERVSSRFLMNKISNTVFSSFNALNLFVFVFHHQLYTLLLVYIISIYLWC